VSESPHAIDERFEAARSAARSAGRLAMEYFARAATLDVEHKGTQDLVSEADRETEHLITRELLTAFPEDAFVGEEHGLTPGLDDAGTWVVDPIDGTQPFLLGLPTWCISIAYADADGVQIGVIHNPVTDETYAARRGAGATRNGTAIHVRSASMLNEGLTGVGCSPRTQPDDLAEIMRRLLGAGGMYQRTGSGALNLAYVAAGQLIGYVEMHIHAWDCLAAVCLIEAAGGTVSPFLADYGVAGAGPLVAGAPGVYPALVDLLPGYGTEH
jgi:myo-inositol-1(or 4)-monophosphatase